MLLSYPQIIIVTKLATHTLHQHQHSEYPAQVTFKKKKKYFHLCLYSTLSTAQLLQGNSFLRTKKIYSICIYYYISVTIFWNHLRYAWRRRGQINRTGRWIWTDRKPGWLWTHGNSISALKAFTIHQEPGMQISIIHNSFNAEIHNAHLRRAKGAPKSARGRWEKASQKYLR